MTTTEKLFLIGGGLIALFYVPTIIALSKIEVAFSRCKLLSVSLQGLRLEVILSCKNNSSVPLNFQSADLQLFFNNYHISATNLGIYTKIPANSNGYLSVVFDVPYKDIVASAWNSVIDGNLTENQTLTILGYVKINNKSVRIRRYTFTAREVENMLS